MRSLSLVQAMRPRTTVGKLLLSALVTLIAVPPWTGDERLALLDRNMTITALPYPAARDWPRRTGALFPVGAITLSGSLPAFGGFSSINVARGRVLLLSDQGNWLSFALRRGRPLAARNGFLPDGPGTGWEKAQRDSESLVRDPASGRMWVGFENANQIWRYAPGFASAQAMVAPKAMRKWKSNSGAEAMVRLADGRFVVFAEGARSQRRHRAVILSGDPVAPGTHEAEFRFIPPTGFRPSDAALLPDGNVLVLVRRFELPFRFRAKLVLVSARDIRANANVGGRIIATLDNLVRENCEGLAITREPGGIYVWIVTDNDESRWRPTILMKFRLAAPR